ncbi:MAG: hypothetical protein IJL13_07480 [Spirochaetales bacterium]|nr:hypothetical protein [Spirochaetales bacterium]
MKKRNLLMLGLIALMAVVVFVSCMQDPILDNKAIGKWIAQNNMGDKITLDVKSDQTFVMVLEQDGGEEAENFIVLLKLNDDYDDSIKITVTGKWDASSVSEGTMVLKELGTKYTFTAYDKVLTLYNSEMGSIEFSRV